MPPRLVLAALLVAGALVSGDHGAARDIQPNDEGLMLQAAERIASAARCPTATSGGSTPRASRTCWPGCRSCSGPSLLTWRIVRVLADATVAVLAYALARRAAGPRASLAAWAAAILAMAYPSGPHPFPIALALALGALLAFEARPALAGVLVGRGGGVADRVRRVRGGRAILPRAPPAGAARASRSPRRRPPPSSTLPVVHRGGHRPELGPARRLPADRLPRLPDAAVPALLRRPAEHELARRLPHRQRSSRCCSSTCRSRS